MSVPKISLIPGTACSLTGVLLLRLLGHLLCCVLWFYWFAPAHSICKMIGIYAYRLDGLAGANAHPRKPTVRRIGIGTFHGHMAQNPVAVLSPPADGCRQPPLSGKDVSFLVFANHCGNFDICKNVAFPFDIWQAQGLWSIAACPATALGHIRIQ